MYTGKTEQPCCLCGGSETSARVDLPPRAIPAMQNSDRIAWRDVEGDVSIHFCESDWAVVADLVLETGMSPLSRCNVAHASFDLRSDFEALVNETRGEPDHSAVEDRLRAESERVLAEYGDPDSLHERRDLVEARLVQWVLDDAVADA